MCDTAPFHKGSLCRAIDRTGAAGAGCPKSCAPAVLSLGCSQRLNKTIERDYADDRYCDYRAGFYQKGISIVAPSSREKLTVRVNSEILSEVRAIANSEGRRLQALIDEALNDLIEKRRQSCPRARVMTAYQASHETYATLYKKLAD